MPLPTITPGRLALFLIVSALLTKVYQHNKLVYFTYTNQNLSQKQAQLMEECAELQARLQETGSNKSIMKTAKKNDGMKPLQLSAIVPLSTALPGAAS